MFLSREYFYKKKMKVKRFKIEAFHFLIFFCLQKSMPLESSKAEPQFGVNFALVVVAITEPQ